MLKKFLIATVGLLVLIGVIVGVYASMIRTLIAASANMPVPRTSVATTEVQPDEWESTLTAVGTLVAVQGTIIKAEAEGVVRHIAFKAGSVVEAGTVLVELDTEVEASQLRAAEAAQQLAEANWKRSQELFGSKTISQAELDSTDAARKQAAAEVDAIRAMIAKKTVRAPFAGRLGIRQISLGQFLNKGDAVVSLQSFDPIYAEFSLPQQNLAALESGLEVRVTTDAYPDEEFVGEITALNPQIDPATRMMRVQATLPNEDGRLRAGLFVEVEVVLPEKRSVLMVPGTSIMRSPAGNSVYVVESGAEGGESLVAKLREVKTGSTRGDFVTVVAGLKEGERIVQAGGFKLQDGAPVVVSDLGVPEPDLNPTPADN